MPKAPSDSEELHLTDPDAEEEAHDDLPRGQKRYITRAGAERLHSELLRLLNTERPKVTAEVSAAAAQGDRSENAEYIYGKKRLREIDRRIHFLQRRLDSSTVVDPAEQTEKDRVFFGATVTLEDEDGKRTTYQVVGPDETDTKGGRISMDSPVGKALLRKAKGDEVVVNRPRGEVELTIVEIRYL
ncbi:MAG TPA: transcription elongation factor GreB [Myxococcaceae bacterium]|nr:transcription elongation factor GreB [Myxococcaceae bacterium]